MTISRRMRKLNSFFSFLLRTAHVFLRIVFNYDWFGTVKLRIKWIAFTLPQRPIFFPGQSRLLTQV